MVAVEEVWWERRRKGRRGGIRRRAKRAVGSCGGLRPQETQEAQETDARTGELESSSSSWPLAGCRQRTRHSRAAEARTWRARSGAQQDAAFQQASACQKRQPKVKRARRGS